jgi:hypothetical protein
MTPLMNVANYDRYVRYVFGAGPLGQAIGRALGDIVAATFIQ